MIYGVSVGVTDSVARIARDTELCSASFERRNVSYPIVTSFGGGRSSECHVSTHSLHQTLTHRLTELKAVHAKLLQLYIVKYTAFLYSITHYIVCTSHRY